jgi:hypothetical protein
MLSVAWSCVTTSIRLRRLPPISGGGACTFTPRLYGTLILVGPPTNPLRYLQSVLNVATRFSYRLGRYDHLTGALVSHHWLRVTARIDYKTIVQSYYVCMAQLIIPIITQTFFDATPTSSPDSTCVHLLPGDWRSQPINSALSVAGPLRSSPLFF